MSANRTDGRGGALQNVHAGHRGRMRAKLLMHGQRIFDTYELLEMLLYYTVPYKDTNPIAKNLLSVFGDLDGVFRAGKEELLGVEGVGERTASLIGLVGQLSEVFGAELVPYEKSIFSVHCDAGGFFVEYFKGTKEKKVTAVYLDNNMELISIEDVAVGKDYDSAAIKAKPFLDGAIRNNASAVITAHNHPFGSPYPTPGDRATNSMVKLTLDSVRVTLAEHFVVSGDSYVGTMQTLSTNFCQSPYLDEFIKARGDGEVLHNVSDETFRRLSGNYNVEDSDYFVDLLSYTARGAVKENALALLKRFHTIEATVNARSDILKDLLGESTAAFVKLLAYITSRRVTDKFVTARPYSEIEIADYLKALYLGESEEEVFLLAFDQKNRFIGAELIGSGTVNSSDVLSRKLLESAVRLSASKVFIAHNHPGGRPEASSDDLESAARFKELLRISGIELLAHCVIAGQKCLLIDLSGIRTDLL